MTTTFLIAKAPSLTPRTAQAAWTLKARCINSSRKGKISSPWTWWFRWSTAQVRHWENSWTRQITRWTEKWSSTCSNNLLMVWSTFTKKALSTETSNPQTFSLMTTECSLRLETSDLPKNRFSWSSKSKDWKELTLATQTCLPSINWTIQRITRKDHAMIIKIATTTKVKAVLMHASQMIRQVSVLELQCIKHLSRPCSNLRLQRRLIKPLFFLTKWTCSVQVWFCTKCVATSKLHTNACRSLRNWEPLANCLKTSRNTCRKRRPSFWTWLIPSLRRDWVPATCALPKCSRLGLLKWSSATEFKTIVSLKHIMNKYL